MQSTIDIPKGLEDKVLKFLDYVGIRELNPVQEEAIKTGYLNGRNLVVSSPTGSGKTLIAELAVFGKRKVVYTCPLRALANEKYDEFKVFERFGKNVAISIGNLDEDDPWLADYDIIITTNEKLDSLMRHRARWLSQVDLLIVDEIHLLDTNRGPTLENVVMRFKYLYPKTQIIALSATIPNSYEIGEWLNAEVVVSDWRPVKLELGVYANGILETTDGTYEVEEEYKDELKSLVRHFVGEGKNILIFTTTRKSAEATAEKLGNIVKEVLPEKSAKDVLSKDVLSALEVPTKQCRRLAQIIDKGVAFHHAGLVNKQRKLIEDAFREGKLKIICSTPTLAMGVNLPADVVIMKSLIRYSPRGPTRIPKREFFQCAGRAGRPQYSDKGVAIVIAKNEDEKEVLWENYIMGAPEEVYSQLGREPILRTHVLASIAMGIARDQEKLNSLFLHSFFAHQYKDTYQIESILNRAVETLESWDFVEIDSGKLKTTRIGQRVSELYIEPYSAYKIIEKLKSTNASKLGPIGWLYLIVDTEEMKPYLRTRKKEEEEILEFAMLNEGEIGVDVESSFYEDYQFSDKVKTVRMLNDWINEATEEDILERYNIAPGILRGYLTNADWIAYSASELARLIGKGSIKSEIGKVRSRIRYGVKEELLPLVRIRGIGRIKARRLYNAGIKNPEGIKKFKDKRLLEKMIGKNLVSRVLEGDYSDS